MWCLSGLLFKIDYNYYNLLKLPWFTLSGKYIGIIWFIIYILNTISIIKVTKMTNIFKNNDYLYILLTNYISNELFIYFFFKLMSPFLGLAITTIVSLSSYFLYIETRKISKSAITNFTVLERFKKATLIECVLETGRTHQIRVHMDYINHPVVNDPVYGKRKVINDYGQMLHAYYLGFNHPITHEFMEFKKDPEKEFNDIVEMFRNS